MNERLTDHDHSQLGAREVMVMNNGTGGQDARELAELVDALMARARAARRAP